MNSIRPELTILFFVVFLLVPASSLAQLPAPATVPAGLSEEVSQQLNSQRSSLEETRQKLEHEIEQHNLECGQVRADDTALVEKCRQRMAHIQSEVDKFMTAVNQFDQAVERTAAEAIIAEKQDVFEKETTQMMNEMLADSDLHAYSAMEQELMADPEWFTTQRAEILKAVQDSKKWTNEILNSIKTNRYPDPQYRPKSLKDLQPGDILLPEPEGVGSILAVAEQLITGQAFKSGKITAPASHAAMFLRNPNTGEMVFFDHTSVKGSHLLDKDQFQEKYSHRKTFIARPIETIAGEEIWKVATEEAKKTKEGKVFGSKYGFFGNDVVCSEEMALVIARVTKLPFEEYKHKGVVMYTPGDFFDQKRIGKFFVVTPLEEEWSKTQ